MSLFVLTTTRGGFLQAEMKPAPGFLPVAGIVRGNGTLRQEKERQPEVHERGDGAVTGER